MSDLPQSLKSVGAVGTPTYNVGPGGAPVPFPVADGRHHALTIFAKYLSLLKFNKGDGRGGVTPFQIPLTRIFFEWPDYEKTFLMPCIFIGAASPDGVLCDFIGNVPFMLPGSEDKYQPGTAVYEWAEHVETLTLVVYAKDRAERRALMAGLQIALNPMEEISGVRFSMADYFDEVVEFSFEGGGRIEDDEASKNRRRLELKVSMRFNLAYLSNAQNFVPDGETDLATASE